MARQLQDSYGRAIGDWRISITDRCNFRCTYCIPVENIVWKPRGEILSYEEIERLVSIGITLGIRKVRLTGGEPLLRTGVVGLVRRLKALRGVEDLALTTNGKLLPAFAADLRAAGLDRINVSLDSLRPDVFAQLTKRNALAEVLEGIESATRAGFHPVKINAVVIRGVNEDEVVDFARFAHETGHTVRFIEFMPLDSGHLWSRDQVVSGAEIIERISSELSLIPIAPRSAAETARRFGFAGGKGEIGVITPVSNPFCGNCNRIRITADGQLRSCLFSLQETDLKTPLRSGFSDEEIAGVLREAVWAKEAGHK
ncbi:MAG TPA: GTP 3',8-cyclase MoaA, partial [Thermoanaerobaculia bacterium]|nr:GTP 3',8-cyclase MoaA [Thermoanaerobaculia bacterium]